MYVPSNVVTNNDLTKYMDTNDEWIQERTGIKERRYAHRTEETTTTMGVEAATIAIERAGITPQDIDFIVFATLSPDYYFPGCGVLLQRAMKMTQVGALDVRNQCSGFVYALSVADQFIKSGMYKNILVVGAEKHSFGLDFSTRGRNVSVIFGDGAGAVLLEPSKDDTGIQDFILKSDGTGENHLIMKGGGSRFPASHETIDNRWHHITQEGPSVFKFAVTNMADVSAEIMEKNNLVGDDIAWLVPHQANKRIIDATANRMGIGPEKVMLNIQKYGNTTAGTIPLCLFDYESQLKKGDNLVLAAFGGDFITRSGVGGFGLVCLGNSWCLFGGLLSLFAVDGDFWRSGRLVCHGVEQKVGHSELVAVFRAFADFDSDQSCRISFVGNWAFDHVPNDFIGVVCHI